eukprot:7395231-Alexandrium_andersonii.AAC.1
MSASLVGSEMCIRDRALELLDLAGALHGVGLTIGLAEVVLEGNTAGADVTHSGVIWRAPPLEFPL